MKKYSLKKCILSGTLALAMVFSSGSNYARETKSKFVQADTLSSARHLLLTKKIEPVESEVSVEPEVEEECIVPFNYIPYTAKEGTSENIDILVEIKLLLEKNNLTSEDLINLLYTSRYQDASNEIFNSHPELDSAKILSLLDGNQIIFRDNLYLGDSRTQGMILSGVVNEQNTVYGVGYGYSWLIGKGNFSSNKTNALNGGINGLETKMDANKNYNIVIWLGVNDYRFVSANTYYQKFAELATNEWNNHNIYIASVGPVNDYLATTVSNSGINNFNATLKELVNNSGISNLTYIDLNLTQDSINNYDKAGLHYGKRDYVCIYNLMNASIIKNDLKESNNILSFLYSVLLDYDKINTNNEVVDNYILERKR